MVSMYKIVEYQTLKGCPTLKIFDVVDYAFSAREALKIRRDNYRDHPEIRIWYEIEPVPLKYVETFRYL